MNDEFVCDACFGDQGLKAFAEGNAVSLSCSFCGREEKEPIAAPIEEVVAHIDHCIRAEYDEAVNCLPWESAEGGYIGITWQTDELLCDELDLDLPNDDGRLLKAILWQMKDILWCEADPFRLNYAEHAKYSWRRFAGTVKHKRRFFSRTMDLISTTKPYPLEKRSGKYSITPRQQVFFLPSARA